MHEGNLVVDGRYALCRQLGAGMFGSVHLAEHRVMGTRLRDVAVKLFDRTKLTTSTTLDDVLGEAVRLMALVDRCQDPEMRDLFVSCLDAGIDRNGTGGPFVVMELVTGGDLAHRINGQPLPVHTAVGFARQICRAVAALHAWNVLHRDLKPANVLVTKSGHVKIGDFGLATPTTNLLRRAPTVGDLAYQPPDAVAFRDLGASADVYAIGLICYEMLTGRLPFHHEISAALTGNDHAALVTAKRKAPPPPSVTNVEMRSHPRLERVVMRAIAASGPARYPDGGALLDAIETAWRNEDGCGFVDPAEVIREQVRMSRAALRRSEVVTALDLAMAAKSGNDALAARDRVACVHLALVEALCSAGRRDEAMREAAAGLHWRRCRPTLLAVAEAHRDNPDLSRAYRQEAGPGGDPCP